MYKTIKESWESTKPKFKFGEDYIDIENADYIVICPFRPQVLEELNNTLWNNGANFKLAHCLCHSWGAFAMWYKTLYSDGRAKVFFIRKDINLSINYHSQPLTAEFTGWVDFNDKSHLKFTHLVNNHVASGYYGDGAEFACEKCAFSDRVDDSCKDEVEEVNHALESIFDDLFDLYDLYVDKLEDTLHAFLDENYE
jgi:hypothetical protein